MFAWFKRPTSYSPWKKPCVLSFSVPIISRSSHSHQTFVRGIVQGNNSALGLPRAQRSDDRDNTYALFSFPMAPPRGLSAPRALKVKRKNKEVFWIRNCIHSLSSPPIPRPPSASQTTSNLQFRFCIFLLFTLLASFWGDYLGYGYTPRA